MLRHSVGGGAYMAAVLEVIATSPSKRCPYHTVEYEPFIKVNLSYAVAP